MPPGLWIKCLGCEEMVFRKQVSELLEVCPKCNYHFRLTSHERLQVTLDEGSFQEMFADVVSGDPLEWTEPKSYKEKLRGLRESTGLPEAITTGTGLLAGRRIAVGVMDFRFFVASMGSAVGEKVTRLTELATAEKLPLIIFCASGGARMQEGMLSLAQMAKTASAVARHSDAGGLYISVLTDPTTAGVAASFASLGDMVLGEPKALIGFAGPRVIRLTHRVELPEGFQTAEFLLEHGMLDAVVPRVELRTYLTKIIDHLAPLAKQPQPTLAEARTSP
jgi:acetyl-CoA carboxylase carboxyl transferase subunit beta